LLFFCVFFHLQVLIERATPSAAPATEESSEDDDDYTGAEEEDIEHSYDTEDDLNNLDSEEEAEAEAKAEKMPPKPAPRMKSRTPPRQTTVGGGDDLARAMEGLSLTSSYSLNYVCPYMMFQHARGERDCVTCEFLVPILPEEKFQVIVPVSNRRIEASNCIDCSKPVS
jgi:hypothetical protein